MPVDSERLCRRNHFQPTDPGTSWIKDDFVSIDIGEPSGSWRVLTPNVIVLPDGRYRMYHCGDSAEHKSADVTGYILSAISDDGEHWMQEPDIRIDVQSPDAEKWTVCPDVLVLPDGSFRMYFQARSDTDKDVVLSAVSEDGLTWTREPGIRIQDDTANLGSPRCLPLADGRFRLYYHFYPLHNRTGIDAGKCIRSAISDDGQTFVQEAGVRIQQETELESYAVYAPEILRLADETYRMYYAGWSEDPVEGRIFSATSEDGLSWVKDPGICLDNGGAFQEVKVSEPCVAQLPDGRFRMYYEANDRNGDWRILSATSQPAEP